METFFVVAVVYTFVQQYIYLFGIIHRLFKTQFFLYLTLIRNVAIWKQWTNQAKPNQKKKNDKKRWKNKNFYFMYYG